MILLYIYIYRKKKVINIEGQLRGFQGSNYPKTCASAFPHGQRKCRRKMRFRAQNAGEAGAKSKGFCQNLSRRDLSQKS